MVRDRVRVWVIVNVWVRFRVGIWDAFFVFQGGGRGDPFQN